MTRLVLVLGLLAWVGCHGKPEVTAPPPPLRPEPAAAAPKPGGATAHDCEPTDEAHEQTAFTFQQRSITEAGHMADDGAATLGDATNTANDAKTREDAMGRAVKQLLGALAADPYNVKATYNLAAAYARIDRKQCSLNLLARLLQMRTHASKKGEVELVLDRLLGRKQALDPAFADMRTDDRFRKLIQTMCQGSNDPSCPR